jgi:hypothetical protein
MIALLLFFLPSVSCRNYSFTGASVSPEVKTISIPFFPNRASVVQPTLSQVFTEKLRDKFLTQTNLTLKDGPADLLLEGFISDYQMQPTAIQGDDRAALNRLTVSVQVRFSNATDSKQNFESSFSRFADFSASQNFASIEQELIQQIVSQLADDIFNRAMVNW